MKYLLAGSLLAALLAAGGCGPKAAKKETYGRPIPAGMTGPGAPVTPAAEILRNPQTYDGREVLVKGRITSECPSGGWVWVQDSTGQVYVNMHPTNVFIPQRVGRQVTVLGRVVLESGQPQVVGYGLAF